jgi:ribonuclease BN (tRNA processing enzyme)
MVSAGEPPRDLEIYLSHLHWDHVQGLPFFAPLYQAGNRVTVRAAAPEEAERVLREQMSPHVFPIPFGEMPATVRFCAAESTERRGDGYSVRAHPARHPGGALALRFSAHPGLAGGVVYIPDNELDPATPYAAPARWRDELVAFARGARLLVHDAMYMPAEREQRRGWGHSIYSDVVALALDAGVETLALFHHDPERSDDDVEAILGECKRLAAADPRPLTVIAAAEGLRLTV